MITLSTASLYPYGLNRILEIASKSGFPAIELMLRSKTDNAYFDSWDTKYIKDLMVKNNTAVNSVHMPFEFEDAPNNFDEIYNLAQEIGAMSVIAHIPREDQIDYIKWFEEFKGKDLGNGPILLFENVHLKEGKANPIVSHEEMNQLKNICFDIAHSMRSGVDTEKIIASCKNIRQFHVSFWDGKEDHMGLILHEKDFEPLLQNKNAVFCLELCPKAFDDITNPENVGKVLKKNLEFLEGLFNS
jgi:hypothetical protein